MSLVRLLSAAKALTRFSEQPTAYRVRRGALLPKFGLPSDPFAFGQTAETVRTPEQVVVAPVAGGKAGGSIWPWKLRRRREQPFSAARPPLPSNARQAGSVLGPVQCELSLENVKVIRNDLRESDVDVVARAGGTEAGRPPMASSLRLGAMAAEKALDRLAERIVGVETR